MRVDAVPGSMPDDQDSSGIKGSQKELSDKEIRQLLRSEAANLNTVKLTYNCIKACIYIFLVLFFGWLVLSAESFLLMLFGQFMLGVAFAHGLELQHQALHHCLFKGEKANRYFGMLVGLPMLNSYKHYQAQHLHHHKYLGTKYDQEIFNYSADSLKNPVYFFFRVMNISRVPFFLLNLFNFLQGQYPAVISKPADKRQILVDYLLYFSLISAVVIYTIYFDSALFIKLWFVPWLIFAEAVHFFIEAPEHLGCDTDTDQVTRNTRSYKTNWLFQYIANYNNYHVEHHLFPRVCPEETPRLHESLKRFSRHTSDSYADAFRRIFKSV